LNKKCILSIISKKIILSIYRLNTSVIQKICRKIILYFMIEGCKTTKTNRRKDLS